MCNKQKMTSLSSEYPFFFQACDPLILRSSVYARALCVRALRSSPDMTLSQYDAVVRFHLPYLSLCLSLPYLSSLPEESPQASLLSKLLSLGPPQCASSLPGTSSLETLEIENPIIIAAIHLIPRPQPHPNPRPL